MGERLEKLFTLTDIENAFGSPVTIEAGGLIKDTITGKVIARMYLKNNGERPLGSVLVGFFPKDENGRSVPGMRDFRYDAHGVAEGEIFGDGTGILFEDNNTASFLCELQEIEFEDGEFWDRDAAILEAQKRDISSPEEMATQPSKGESGLWAGAAGTPANPEKWGERKGTPDIPDYIRQEETTVEEPPAEEPAAVPEETPAEETAVVTEEAPSEEPEEVPEEVRAEVSEEAKPEAPEEVPSEEPAVEPAAPEQLGFTETPKLSEETEASKEEAIRQTIPLGGPSEDEKEADVIELGGPTEEEKAVETPEEAPEDGFTTDYMQPVRLADMYSGFRSEVKGDPDIIVAASHAANDEAPAEEASQPEQVIPEAPADENDAAYSPEASVREEPVQVTEEPEPVKETGVESGFAVPEVQPEEQQEEASEAPSEEAAYMPPSEKPEEIKEVKEEPAMTTEPVMEEPSPAPEQPEAVPKEKEEAPAEDKKAENEIPDSVMADPETVFAAEPEAAVTVPSIIDDKKQKALTGEDHSGRNLLNIVIFGAIALVILGIIMMNM